MELNINWDAVSALGSWFSGLATAGAVYIALQGHQPKAKVRAKAGEGFHRFKTEKLNFGRVMMELCNIRPAPITIEEIGVITYKPYFSNPWVNQITRYLISKKIGYGPLSRDFNIIQGIELPKEVNRGQTSGQVSIQYKHLGYFLSMRTHQKNIILKFYFQDTYGRYYYSKRMSFHVDQLRKYDAELTDQEFMERIQQETGTDEPMEMATIVIPTLKSKKQSNVDTKQDEDKNLTE